MESIWHQTSAAAPRPPLEEDLSAEAAVIGGGMAGILTAALLEEAQRLDMLNKRRSATLDEIHFREMQLDRMDYLRHKIRESNKRMK